MAKIHLSTENSLLLAPQSPPLRALPNLPPGRVGAGPNLPRAPPSPGEGTLDEEGGKTWARAGPARPDCPGPSQAPARTERPEGDQAIKGRVGPEPQSRLPFNLRTHEPRSDTRQNMKATDTRSEPT